MLVTSGENAKTCPTLISDQKLRSETGFTSNKVNQKFDTRFVDTSDNTCRHLPTPIFAPETCTKGVCSCVYTKLPSNANIKIGSKTSLYFRLNPFFTCGSSYM